MCTKIKHLWLKEIEEDQRPERPGPIDTQTLFGETLREGVDFTFKSPLTWKTLERIYPGSGPPVTGTLLPGNRAFANFQAKHFKIRRSSDLTAAPKDFQVPLDVSTFPPGSVRGWCNFPGCIWVCIVPEGGAALSWTILGDL